jgi:hypothetical protein
MATSRPTIALIHASEASIRPATEAFRSDFPEAELWHLLDNRLVSDADRAGGLTPALHGRMSTLIGYAVGGGADAVQLTCSMYGPVAVDEAGRQPVTVLASDQAMFDHVANLRPRKVGILASLDPAAADSAQRMSAWLSDASVDAEVVARMVAGAADAANRAAVRELEHVLLEEARKLASQVDVIMLAQYSLAPALPALEVALDVPVLSAPHLAATTLAQRLNGER